MIQLKKVSKIYDDGFQALKEIDLTFEEGQLNVLIGPSGCGKTTTMKLLNRLIDYTDGELTINDKLISEINPIDLRRQMGYVIQSIGLFPHMTIYDNVAAVPKLLKWDKKKIDKKVDELLNMVDLDPQVYKKRYPNELSGGQQQRIGVIRALAAEPDIILMDEPFSALDPISREQLQDELVKLQQEINKTIVFVTHDMDEAIKIADQIILMRDGEVVQKGSPHELLTNPANAFVEDFIGSERLEQAKGLPPMTAFIDQNYTYGTHDQSVEAVMKLMLDHKQDQLPIVDENNLYLGVVSLYDAIGQQDKTLNDLIVKVDAYQRDDETKQFVGSRETIAPVIEKDGTFIGVLDQDQVLDVLYQKFDSKSGVKS
ncbi:osmoprotectant transport system ATP-binding protein [Pelagirhabdus alkalitolerans]|uniref:Quaternary amine transport ATP-binding protein n=1 Tax=Pelagirhabdus alkalitolerans TaxID=1612202 RepID=A0A1G6N8G9_9BACI|nr:betaine/proline/choline family ABC transporter ATP-binding protein [Pelagirhabdus alkalitolerans]SDC64152.1 osmoprotectant transport system ATP-binding protein [Pelagirhabdus alkalitolerans]